MVHCPPGGPGEERTAAVGDVAVAAEVVIVVPVAEGQRPNTEVQVGATLIADQSGHVGRHHVPGQHLRRVCGRLCRWLRWAPIAADRPGRGNGLP